MIKANVTKTLFLSLYTSLLSQGLVFTVLGSAIVFAVLNINLPLGIGFVASLVVVRLLCWPALIDNNRSVFLAYILLTLMWCLLVSSQQTSDFGVYYSCRIADSFTSWIHKCQSAWVLDNPTFWRRSLLYSLPIGMLLGKSYLIFKLANCFLHICAVGLLFKLVNQSFGKRPAWLAAIFLALYPEFWFVTTLAVSDNLVLVLLIVWFGLLIRCIDNGTKVRHFVAAALLVIGLDLLRDIGPICLVTLLILSLNYTAGARRKLFLLTLLTLFAWLTAGFVISHFVDTSAKTEGLFARVVGSGVIQSHDWLGMYFWSQYVYPLIDPLHSRHLQMGLLALDLSHGVMAGLSNWWIKISTLFCGYGYYFFSSMPVDNNPDTFIGLAGVPFYHPTPAMETFLSGVTAALLFVAAVGATAARNHTLGRLSLAFCSAFFLLIIGLAETQPRYSLLLAPALGILAAHVLMYKAVSIVDVFRSGMKSAGVFILSLLMVLIVITTAARAYIAHLPIISGFKQEALFQSPTTLCNEAKAILQLNERSISIEFPDRHTVCYSFLVTTKESLQKLNFFLAETPTPPQWKKLPQSPYRLQILTLRNGEYIKTAEFRLGDQAIVPANIPFADNNSHQFKIMITLDGAPTHHIVLDYFYDESGNPLKITQK